MNGRSGNAALIRTYLAAGLDQAAYPRNVSTLIILYCMGEKAEELLTSTNITEGERTVYDTVIAKFDGLFKIRRNVIFEREMFNKGDQLEGESAEQYITSLYSLIEHCDYGALKEELLRWTNP